MDLFNPFKGWSEDVWTWVESLHEIINQIVQNPTELFGGSELSEALFSMLWPLSATVAYIALLALLAGIILMIHRGGVRHLPVAIGAAVVVGMAGSIVWVFSRNLLGLQAEISAEIYKIGPDDIPAEVVENPPFPYMGEGIIQMLVYLVNVMFLGALVLVVLLLVFGAIITPGLLILSAGFLPFGGFGRTFFRTSFILWLISMLVGIPLIVLFVRLGQIVSYMMAPPEDSDLGPQILAWIFGLLLTAIAVVSPFAVYFMAKVIRNLASGGHSSSSVSGDVGADVNNTADVKVEEINDFGDSNQVLDVNVVGEERSHNANTASDPDPGVVYKTAGAVAAGALVTGHPEAAAVAKAVQEEVAPEPAS